MKIFKPTIKVKKFSLVLIILIGLMLLLNISSVLATDIQEVSSNELFTDKNSAQVGTLEELESEENNQIIYTINDVTIILPVGSEFLLSFISDAPRYIQLNNTNETINLSAIVDSLSKINFIQSIDGLNDFNIKVDFQNCLTNFSKNNKAMILNYSIDWGNGDSIAGENVPDFIYVYNYKNQGTYPLTIKMKDSNGLIYYFQKDQSFRLTTAKFVELWVGENKETVAVGSAGIGGIALLGFALTETGKYKLLALLPLLIPMYTRIQKEDVLDQFVRGQIFGFIKSNPGVHYNEIMRKLDMKNGTLSYHLHMLEKSRMIKSRKEQFRYRAFYPTGMKFPKRERYRLTELQMDVIKIIKENPGINQKEIAKKLNEKHQTINYNVKVLQQAELIHLRRNGRKTSCYVFEEDTSDQDN